MYRLIIVNIFFLVLQTACHMRPVIENEKMMADYFGKSTSEQIEHFRDFPIDQQYSLYIYGNQERHPPAVYLSHPFAEQGEKIIPFLKSKLEKAQKEVTIRDIVSVLSEMASQDLYNFKNDNELLTILRKKIDGMKGIWKESTERMLAEIISEMENSTRQ